MSGFRPGVRLGIDVGTARVGVARSDRDGLLATPVETVPRASGDPVTRVAEIARELDAVEIVVGLPISLAGRETASTVDARDFAGALAEASDVPVRLLDERLTTVTANDALRRSGRTQRASRSIVDQIAAVVLLQQALDVEKRTGLPAGQAALPEE
ncbi:MAG TPA: Holliday junction resolvase RuvX [Microbacterium sp.]|nr:Holliday junction resolvase RuvX [Microbacterium sp.]